MRVPGRGDLRSLAAVLLGGVLMFAGGYPQGEETGAALDAKVTAFLESRAGTWRDLNVPEADGQALHDLILKHGYTRAVEIGTSTGLSTIWIAWALAKTGGKVITLEIDEKRYRQALANFEEAGVSAYIDARLGDAHTLTPELEGPFDFVFLDADKDWYTNYAKALMPKLTDGGCLTAHNVSGSRQGRRGEWKQVFFDYLESVPNLETTVLEVSRAGLSVSYKKVAP